MCYKFEFLDLFDMSCHTLVLFIRCEVIIRVQCLLNSSTETFGKKTIS